MVRFRPIIITFIYALACHPNTDYPVGAAVDADCGGYLQVFNDACVKRIVRRSTPWYVVVLGIDILHISVAVYLVCDGVGQRAVSVGGQFPSIDLSPGGFSRRPDLHGLVVVPRHDGLVSTAADVADLVIPAAGREAEGKSQSSQKQVWNYFYFHCFMDVVCGFLLPRGARL